MRKLIFFMAIGSTALLSANQYGYGQNAKQGGHYDQAGRYHCPGCNGSDAFYQDLSNTPGTYHDSADNNVPSSYYQLPQGQSHLRNQTPYSQSNQNTNNQNRRNGLFNNNRGSSFYDQSYETARSGQPNDREIESEIRDDLSPGWFSRGYENVTFQVQNGNVILRGTVETNDDKEDIESSVKDIEGVRQINNLIIVTGRKNQRMNSANPSNNAFRGNRADDRFNGNSNRAAFGQNGQHSQDFGATQADRSLNQRIRDRLKGGWFTRGYDALIIKTSNGVVTIIGSVDEEKDIPKVTDEVKKVEGVKRVNAQISVKKPN